MIDPTDTLQDALYAAANGDAEALAWLEVCAPDMVESFRVERADQARVRGAVTMRGRVVGYRPAETDPVLGLLLAVDEPKGHHRSVSLAEQEDAQRFLADLRQAVA
jgi:hypothetical protein